MLNRIVVVLPTYNESESLTATLDRIRTSAPDVDVLIVDDNSPDGTGHLADRLALADPRIRVLHRPLKQGLGAAYLEGFARALDHGYEVIVQCDADGSHHPEELHRLLDQLDDNDMAVGSRWVAGGRVVDWPWARTLLSRGGSSYARIVLGLHQRDVTGGYRAFRASALHAIGLDSVTSQGYCFQIEMLWRAHRAGLRITEVPITFTDRERGTSKMRGAIIVEAMARVTGWAIFDRHPLVRSNYSSRAPHSPRATIASRRANP